MLWCLALKVNPSLAYLKTGGDAEIFLYKGVFFGGGMLKVSSDPLFKRSSILFYVVLCGIPLSDIVRLCQIGVFVNMFIQQFHLYFLYT